MANGWKGLAEQPNGRLLFECPEPYCYHRLLVKDANDTQHNCPEMGHTTYGWSETVKLVSQIWDMLDEAFDIVKDPNATPEAKAAAGPQCRAYCKTLVLFMTPIFTTDQEVAREALARWKARQEGVDHFTPGMMHATYKTVMDGEVMYEGNGGWVHDPAFATGAPRINSEVVKNRMNAALEAAASQSGAEATRLHWQAQGKPAGRGVAAASDKAPPRSKASQQQLPVAHGLDDKKLATFKQFAAGGVTRVELSKMFGITLAQVDAILDL